MPKDIFGGWMKGPSREEIEAEAAKEVERLTRPTGPPPDMAAALGPRSPLEQMAEQMKERKRGRRGRPKEEDRSGYV